MPKETKAEAVKRAKELGMPASQVVKAKDDGWFIAPNGVTAASAKRAYANCRADGKSAATCAKIAHGVQDIIDKG